MTTHTPEQVEQLAARLDARWASQRTDAARVFELDHEQAAVMARRYEAEADECSLIALALRAYAEGMRREAAPVATLRFQRGTPGQENEMPRVVSCNWLPDGTYEVYLAPAPSYAEVRRDALEEAWPADPNADMLDAAHAAQPGFSNAHIAAQYRAMRAAAIRKLKEA